MYSKNENRPQRIAPIAKRPISRATLASIGPDPEATTNISGTHDERAVKVDRRAMLPLVDAVLNRSVVGAATKRDADIRKCAAPSPRRSIRRTLGSRALHALALTVLLALPQLSVAAAIASSAANVGADLVLPEPTCVAPDARTLNEFARAVQQHIADQAKPGDYPRAALDERLQGTVYLRLTYTAGVQHPATGVHRSSGHAVLDEYAIALARRSALQAPSAMRCRAFDISFPLRFKIAPADAPESK